MKTFDKDFVSAGFSQQTLQTQNILRETPMLEYSSSITDTTLPILKVDRVSPSLQPSL